MKHLIKVALVFLAAVAASYVYGFTSLVAPWYVALGAAGSLVGTYVGLAFADIPHEQRGKAMAVAWAAMVVEALYGVLYVLSVQSPEVFRAPLPLWLSVPLAILHGAAFSVMAFFVSMFVVHERRMVAHEERPTVQVMPTPVPLLEDDRISVNGRTMSLRQLARLTGTPLSTLRRQLKEED
jgi:hypothetical protein